MKACFFSLPTLTEIYWPSQLAQILRASMLFKRISEIPQE